LQVMIDGGGMKPDDRLSRFHFGETFGQLALFRLQSEQFLFHTRRRRAELREHQAPEERGLLIPVSAGLPPRSRASQSLSFLPAGVLFLGYRALRYLSPSVFPALP